ncbi:hypothetical protein NKH71_03095 [Mesorhizobium sp. M0983]|uniref:DNA polymerase III subunit beta family protein n=1 Tax=Mesorhizobium sp. M0983 TaxID=2957040 RepID=UPI00333588F3
MIKFSVAGFAEAAKAIRNIPGASREIEILDHARLHARKGQMTLTMSDLDIEAHVTFPCEVKGEVLAAVPRAVLEFFIARTGGDDAGTLDFDADMKQVVARHGKGRVTMQILPGSDFYLIETTKFDWTMKLRAHELCEVLRRCEKALSADLNRIMLHGPFLHQRDGLKLIGADGHRVHVIDLDGPEMTGDLPQRNTDILPGIIVPPKTAKEIQRIFSGDESEITVSGTDRLLVIEAEHLRIASKLIDATYIDYPRMVPQRTESRIVVSADALGRALDGLLVVPKSDAKGKRETVRTVRITMREDAIELFARGDGGDAEDAVEITNEGVKDGTEITFAANFLRDAIEAAGAKQIAIHPPADFGMPFHITGAEGAMFVIGQRRM